MARDNDNPPAGDDPWAGLEADSQPGSEPDFTFSFDDDAAADGPALDALMAEEPAVERPDASEPRVADPLAEELVAEAIGFGASDSAPDAAIDSLLEEGLEAAADPALDSLLDAEAPQEDDDAGHPDVIPSADAFAGAAAEGPADADIDDWLNGPVDAETSASSVLGSGVFHQSHEDGGEMPDFAAGDSTVNIGTGTSGIGSPSGVASPSEDDMFGEAEPAAAGDEAAADGELDPFAGLTAEGGDDWPAAMESSDAAEDAGAAAAATDDDMFSFMGQAEPADGQEAAPEAELPDDGEATAADFASGFDMGAGAAAAGVAVATAAGGDEAKRGPAPKRRPAPPRKKKPSVIGQLIGVVLGGAMAIPVTMAILIWGFGRDPFNLTPMLPDSVAFLLPAKFRPAGSDTLSKVPSLDDIVGAAPANDGEAALPSAADLTPAEPPTSPVEPEPTDVTAVDPAAAPAADDPLMNLLDETGTAPPPAPPAPVEPPSPPEPEPLDLEKLAAAVAESTAALEAVAAVDDPADPVRKRLLAKWYRSLAGYAEELASLERLATETGRPFEPAVEQGDAIRAGLADHPQLLAELSRLTRDWIAYAKRPSDGVVTPATFVGARRVGPYWRSQVSLAATDTKPAVEMVVLTRTEPAVAPGDAVVITGLAVDDNVVWASELKPAAAGTGFPGL